MESSFLRRFVPLFVMGIAGAVLFGKLIDDVSPRASFDLHFSRGEIMEQSRKYLEDLGFDLKDYQQDATAAFDGTSHVFLQGRYGIRGANEMMRTDTLSTHRWVVSWYDRSLSISQNPETYRVWMTPRGKVLGFEHIINDTISKPSIPPQAAQARAEAFLRAQGVQLERYRLESSSEIKLLNRSDHRFLWVAGDSTTEATVTLRMQGAEISSFQLGFAARGAFQGTFAQILTTVTFVTALSMAVVFFLFFFIVILFLRKYHEGEVGTRTAFLVFLGLFVVSLLSAVNEYPSFGSSTMIGDLNRFNVRIVVFIVTVFIFQTFYCVMAFAAWSVGESSSRSVCPRKMTGADSALFRRYFTFELGAGILRGYAWGFAAAGASAVLTYLLTHQLGVRLFVQSLGGVSESFLLGLTPILEGFFLAAFCEIVFRLFFICFMREKTQKSWPGILISTILWGVTSYTVWVMPFGNPEPLYGFLGMIMFGLFFSYLFWKYDLVTAVVANFALSALSLSIPLFTSSGEFILVHRWMFLGAFALPLCVGMIGIVRRHRFEFSVETMPTHIKRISERERINKELEIARSVQMGLLPKSDPVLAGFDIAGICVPALAVGGDYYDFVFLENQRLGIAVGDVSGKGVPAAIYMTLTKGILQSHAEDNVSPRQVLTKVNSLMYRTIERNTFVSMFYAVLDTHRRTLRFARAGQCPVILSQRTGSDGTFLTPRGMALGLEMGKVFESVLEEQELSLVAGEVLVFYTDGFTEAMNRSQEEFGEDRLIASVNKHRDQSARGLIDGICADVQKFTGDIPQHDDMTMVVLKIL